MRFSLPLFAWLAASAVAASAQTTINYTSGVFDTPRDTTGNPVTFNTGSGISATEQGSLTGTGSLAKTGPGTLTLTGANTHGGGTNVFAGTLEIGPSGSLTHDGYEVATLVGGTSTPTLLIAGGSVTDYYGIIGRQEGAGIVTISGGAWTNLNALFVGYQGGTGTLNLTGGTVQAATVILGAGYGITNGTTGTLNVGTGTTAGTLNTTAVHSDETGTVNFNHNDPAYTFAPNLTGTLSVNQAGTGTTTLTGTNTYAGGTTVTAGVLRAGLAGSFASGTTGADYTVNGGTLDLNGQAFTFSSLNGTGGTVSLGATALTLSLGEGVTATYAGSITGADGMVVKAGAGTQILTGTNSYGGGTQVSGGTLGFASGSLGSGPISVSDATLRWGAGNTQDISDRLALASQVTLDTGANSIGFASTLVGFGTTLNKTGTGSLTLSGSGSFFTAGVAVGQGTLVLSTADALVESNVTLGATSTTGTLRIEGAGSFDGAISGTGNFVKAGTGTLTLSGVNTYAGTTFVNSGTLRLGSATAFSAHTALNLSTGATFDANGYALSLTGLVSPGGSIEISGGLTLAPTSPSAFWGSLTGSGGLTMNGPGEQRLFGASNYTGATTINGGTLAAYAPLYDNGTYAGSIVVNYGGTLALGHRVFGDEFSTPAVTLTVNAGGAVEGSAGTATTLGNVILNGGELRVGDGPPYTLMLKGTVTVGGTTASQITIVPSPWEFNYLAPLGIGGTTPDSATLFDVADVTNSAAADLTITARLVNNPGSSGGLTKTGAGTLALAGYNDYGGTTTLAAGTLALNHELALGASQLLITGGALGNTSGGALTLSTNNAQAWNGNFSFTGPHALNLGTGAVTLDGHRTVNVTASTLTVGGAIGDGGNSYALTKTGAGILVLSGESTYSGVTTVSAGTLQVGAGGTTGSLATSGIALGSGATLAFNRSDALAYASVISGDGGLTQLGTGTLTLTGTNTYAGGTNLNGGTLAIASSANLGAAGGSVAFNGGTLQTTANLTAARATTLNAGGGTFDTAAATTLTWTGNIDGSGALTKTGSGTLTLSGATTYAGATTIAAGTLALGASHRLADTTAVTVASGATFNLAGYADTIGSLAGAGNVTLGAGILTSGADHTSTGFSGIISGTGGLTKTGTGTLTLSGASTYSGGTTLSEGVIELAHNQALGTGALSLNGGTLVALGGTRTLANNFTLNADTTISGSHALTLTGTGTLTGFKSLTIASGTTATLSGAIGQSRSSILIKEGAGELRLNGANTYTGGTLISEGTTRINNTSGSAFGTGAVTVAQGATLAGAGSFTGALQLNGTFSPGNSPGTTSTGSQTWAGGAGYIWETNNATGLIGTHTDLLSISGSLTINATNVSPFTISLVSLLGDNSPGAVINFNSAQNYTYTIATTTTGITGFSSSAFTINASGFTNNLNGGSWNLAQSGNNLNLNFASASAIPEPSTYAAAAGMAALGLAFYRRRRTG